MRNEVFKFMGIVWRKSSSGMEAENHEQGERILSLNLPQTYAVLKLLETVRATSGLPTPSIAPHLLQEGLEDMYQSLKKMFAYQYQQELKSLKSRSPQPACSSYIDEKEQNLAPQKDRLEKDAPSSEDGNRTCYQKSNLHCKRDQPSEKECQVSLICSLKSRDNYEAFYWRESIEEMALSFLYSGYSVHFKIDDDGFIRGIETKQQPTNHSK